MVEAIPSKTLIDKLKLPTSEHHHPHKLQWLNEESDLKVTKQTLISFSIGKNYQDQDLCDVISMDACHLLLGRPWQYDRNNVHDGHKNTCSLHKEQKHITLPFNLSMIHKNQPTLGNTSKENIFLGET